MSDEKRILDEIKVNDTREQVRVLKQQLPALLEVGIVLAQICKANYDALVEAGFTPEQALEIIKSKGTSLT